MSRAGKCGYVVEGGAMPCGSKLKSFSWIGHVVRFHTFLRREFRLQDDTVTKNIVRSFWFCWFIRITSISLSMSKTQHHSYWKFVVLVVVAMLYMSLDLDNRMNIMWGDEVGSMVEVVSFKYIDGEHRGNFSEKSRRRWSGVRKRIPKTSGAGRACGDDVIEEDGTSYCKSYLGSSGALWSRGSCVLIW